MIVSVPTLDQLARDPALAFGLPLETIAGLLAKHAAAGSALGAALVSRQNAEQTQSIVAVADEEENWLTPDQAAEILKYKKRWIYRHAATLPWGRKVSNRGYLCSEKGLRRWLERRKI